MSASWRPTSCYRYCYATTSLLIEEACRNSSKRTGISSTTLPQALPLMLVLFLFKCLVHPWSRRKQLWSIISRVIRAPFCEVRFVDTYVADVLASMVKVLLDALWCCYFFLSGAFLRSESDRKNLSDLQNTTHSFWYKQVLAPAVCFFPIWFRFAQCLRKYVDVGDGHRRWVHLWNAAKYAFSLIVTIHGGRARHARSSSRGGVSYSSASIFSWVWDVHVDWGLNFCKVESSEDTSFRRPSSFDDQPRKSGGIYSQGRRACIPRSGGTGARRSWICSGGSSGWRTVVWSLPTRLGARICGGFSRVDIPTISHQSWRWRSSLVGVWGLLSAGARASIERVSASEGGAIRAVAFAGRCGLGKRRNASCRRRDGFHRGSGHCPRVAHDDPRARFRQIGALERTVAHVVYPDTNKSLPIDVDDDLTVAHHHHHHTHNDDVADDDAIDDDAPSEKKSSGKRRRRRTWWTTTTTMTTRDRRCAALRRTLFTRSRRWRAGAGMPLPGPRPLFVFSRIVDEPPLPRRRRDQRSLREPGPGKRSPWSREAGERAARRRVDDVAADDSPRTARSGSRAGSQVTGSAASRVISAAYPGSRAPSSFSRNAACAESWVYPRSASRGVRRSSGCQPPSVSRRAAPR